jgi:hypothetical protein
MIFVHQVCHGGRQRRLGQQAADKVRVLFHAHPWSVRPCGDWDLIVHLNVGVSDGEFAQALVPDGVEASELLM